MVFSRFIVIYPNNKMMMKYLWIILATGLLFSCNQGDSEEVVVNDEPLGVAGQEAILEQFGGSIDLANLPNYANQAVPGYINEDNTDGNPITDGGAVLGRVLFYDTNLSSDNTIACASCHKQEFAFGDDAIASTGVNGTTGRHSMRLVNARFAEEDSFFWDERANSLEDQSTMPIQDHIEMGFSGQDGDPSFTDLIAKLEAIEYYEELFTHVYGDASITEQRMQNALAQFVRSIQSFDSKYDLGRAQENGNRGNFNNFTTQENNGKELFMDRPDFNNNGVRIGGGLGCDACHRAPEFDIDDNSDNNGVIGTISGIGTDTQVTRSPSLRDLFNAEGISNGPFMHNGFSNDFMDVLDHYDQINRNGNNNLDRRLRPMGNGQNLSMTQAEKEAV
ncbi:MAG: cytochrome-c peroxidase, partial [Cyclobacteriaceae bacterium]